MNKIFPAMVSFFLCFSLVQAADFDASQIDMPVHHLPNVAHRGFSHIAPENTLIAYKMAVQIKADGAECDVYTTADGVLVLSHDKNMKRTMGRDVALTDLTFEEFRKADAGIWKGKHFRGEVPPTLEEYLDLLKGTTCHPVIELKMDGIEQAVIDAVKKHDMLDVTTIIAFSEKAVAQTRKIEKNVCVAFLYSEDMKDKSAEKEAPRLTELLLQKCRELDTKILHLNHGLLSKELIDNLHSRGVTVWAWTVNDAKTMEKLLDLGIVSITTDRPDILNDVLQKRNGK